MAVNYTEKAPDIPFSGIPLIIEHQVFPGIMKLKINL
jgi:hypothetical protein